MAYKDGDLFTAYVGKSGGNISGWESVPRYPRHMLPLSSWLLSQDHCVAHSGRWGSTTFAFHVEKEQRVRRSHSLSIKDLPEVYIVQPFYLHLIGQHLVAWPH